VSIRSGQEKIVASCDFLILQNQKIKILQPKTMQWMATLIFRMVSKSKCARILFTTGRYWQEAR
jgi:hypothetical protein